MNRTEKIEMNLNIAGTQIAVTVPFSDQEAVRDVESMINRLYSDWRHKYKKRTDHQILAMVAYQFAKYYHGMCEREQQASETLRQCLDIMADIEHPDVTPMDDTSGPLPPA